ncbi:MAG: M28 family peptidase [Porphyromonadaceae bacterium]|nr:M28 family peptidase [Porphyromonadaceae bacterium]
MKSKLSVFIAFVLLFAILSLLLSCGRTAKLNTGNDKSLLDTTGFKRDLFILSSDSMEGRMPGTRGGKRAADYIANRFRQYGLIPCSADQGYFQKVNIESFQPDYTTAKISITGKNFEEKIIPYNEMILISRDEKPSVDVEGDLVFVGYGTVAPEYEWDDYKNVDVSDKIVVCLFNHPDFRSPDYTAGQTTYYGKFDCKAETAFRKGAKGILFIFQEDLFPYDHWQNVISNFSFGDYAPSSKIPMVSYITESAFDRIMANEKMNLSQLIEKADSKDFHPFPLSMKIHASFKQKIKKYSTHNVIGYVRGTKRPDEAFIYMAHYDHLGVMRPVQGDSIYNGAIDNASGTAGIISLAKYFSVHPPERSVVFLATTAEELSFQGVFHYLAHPLIPLEKTIAGVNIDMMDFLGSTDSINLSQLQYTDAYNAVKSVTDEMNIGLNASGIDKMYLNFRLESYPFALHDILMLNLVFKDIGNHHDAVSDNQLEMIKSMGGLNYHTPFDEIKPWFRYDGILQELELAKNIGLFYSNKGKKPIFRDNNPYEPAKTMWISKH